MYFFFTNWDNASGIAHIDTSGPVPGSSRCSSLIVYFRIITWCDIFRLTAPLNLNWNSTIMAINEATLTKGQIRKLNALRKSIGDALAEEAFSKWLKQEKSNKPKSKADPVAMKIAEALQPLIKGKSLNLGQHGYVVKRARGKGAKGIIVRRIVKT